MAKKESNVLLHLILMKLCLQREISGFWHLLINDNNWTPVFEVYEKQPSWPVLKPPDPKDFLFTLLHTKDSAPGPDGSPYSAWRLLPCVSVDALISYFYDIIGGAALPPMQVGVWIPKAKTGPTANHFRPLGMPNTIDRLVDGNIAAYIMRHTAHLMHPSQAVMSYFKEPQKAVSCIQRILDGDSSACVLLADLSKAFERVNPYWILALLRIRKAPAWLIAYTKFVLFHRRVTHKVQGRLLPSRTLRQGVDIGSLIFRVPVLPCHGPSFHLLKSDTRGVGNTRIC